MRSTSINDGERLAFFPKISEMFEGGIFAFVARTLYVQPKSSKRLATLRLNISSEVTRLAPNN